MFLGEFGRKMADTDLVGRARADKNAFLWRISCNLMLRNPLKVVSEAMRWLSLSECIYAHQGKLRVILRSFFLSL